jgi:drug/metabolite transporter (DMT)-like permease
MLWSALAFSVMSAMVKLVGTRIPSAEIAIVRGAVTLVASYLFLRRAGISPWEAEYRWLFARGLLGFFGLHSYFYALTELPLAEATVIQFLNPILVALAAPLVLGEAFSLRDAVGSALGFFGVLFIARPAALFDALHLSSSHDAAHALSPMGVAVGVFGAVCSALVYLVVRKLKDKAHALVVVFHFPLLVVPLSLPLAIPIWVWPTWNEWLVLLAVGLTAQWGQMKMTESLHQETAARATAVSFAQVVFAMFFSVTLFGEVPTWSTWVGAAFVFTGTLLVARMRRATPAISAR